MFGYSARNALATASATFTSTDEYQTTLPSFAAAATIAGVVSWAVATLAIAPHARHAQMASAADRAARALRCRPAGRCAPERRSAFPARHRRCSRDGCRDTPGS